ncbi:E3 ubiquitin/ISG15 ligase TRIM25-like isoform X1 [Brachyistius frenatus]|uniref:E3 ubiquitin/ISG15 ligase TRIM25-like isoform X1 n=1 Tax=Brachyistius frenatus TaxID=100188 RepID=UPI0037E8CFF0
MAELCESLLGLEDELTCSICLGTFDCPVTIPCGHNFCQDCLLSSWKDSYSCPQCRTLFPTKPELKKNTVLSTVVETFNLRSNKSEASLFEEETATEKKTEHVIRCDTCMEAKAAQTCLTCMASFCDEHLQPHRENPVFRLHQLSEPVGDLSERICPDHHKLMELFCSQHSRPICSLCLQQTHKGCSFTSPEEQRTLKESEFKDKLGQLDEKIEKTDTIVYQMNELQSKLKDAATKRKTALAAVYQQMRDMLAQDEREAQHEVDLELEIGQTKLLDLSKKFTENSERMRKAKVDINGLLSQSQAMAFLQASFEMPRVVKFEPHMPRINLDSKKVIAGQTFATALKESLTETFKQPVEARSPLPKPGEKEAPFSGPEGAGGSGNHPETAPARQKMNPQRSKSPGRPPIQPWFQPVSTPMFYESHGWNPTMFPQGHSQGSYRGPCFSEGQKTYPQKCKGETTKKTLSEKTEKKTVCKPAHKMTPKRPETGVKHKDMKKDTSQQPHHRQDRRPPSASGGARKDKPKNQYPHHPHSKN